MAGLNARNKEEREAMVQQMANMRDSGKTYQEIAEKFNISKQRVYQIIGSNGPKFFRHITATGCIYNGVRQWMNDNKVSITEMTRRLYGNYSPVNFNRVRNKLNGSASITKKYIDKILEITGLTYEVAFAVDSEVQYD